jgi:hypothetical protein
MGEDLLRRTNPLTYLGPDLTAFLIQHAFDDDLCRVEQSTMPARGGDYLNPTSDSMARAFASLSAALTPFGKAALGEAS